LEQDTGQFDKHQTDTLDNNCSCSTWHQIGFKMERRPGLSIEVIHAGASLAEIMLMEEVSELTRIPRSTLRFYRHAGQGQGPRSFKLGGRICYKRSDVEAWIESQYQAEGVR